MENQEHNVQVIVSGDGVVRGKNRNTKNISVQDLSTNINMFVEQVNIILSTTPEKVGGFRLDEIEIHAEITAKGSLAILGTGGEVGGSGGLRFVFRRGQKTKS